MKSPQRPASHAELKRFIEKQESSNKRLEAIVTNLAAAIDILQKAHNNLGVRVQEMGEEE